MLVSYRFKCRNDLGVTEVDFPVRLGSTSVRNWVQEGKHGENSEVTQDDRYTQVERWILMAGTARSADLVSTLDQEEAPDADFCPSENMVQEGTRR